MSAFLQPFKMTRTFFEIAEKWPETSLSDLFLFTIGALSPLLLLMREKTKIRSSSRDNTVVTSLQISVSVFGASCKFFSFLHLQIYQISGRKKCQLKSTTSIKAAKSVYTLETVVSLIYPAWFLKGGGFKRCRLCRRVQGVLILPHSPLLVSGSLPPLQDSLSFLT